MVIRVSVNALQVSHVCDSGLVELIVRDLFLLRSFARSSFLECAGSAASNYGASSLGQADLLERYAC
jgi:hypothetical protein